MTDDDRGRFDDLAIGALHSIRDEIRGLRSDTNERLDQANERLDQTNERLDQTNERLNQTNERLDLLHEGQMRTATEVVRLAERVDVNTAEIRQLRGRFEHFLDSEGAVVRNLQARMNRVESHLDLDPLG